MTTTVPIETGLFTSGYIVP
jgi:hypothetical protein